MDYLTANEFEVLQLLVRLGTVSVNDLRDALTPIKIKELNIVIELLFRKGLIVRSGKFLLAQPLAKDKLEPYRVKRAIILAAGKGTRMLPATKSTPKTMIHVNKKRIIETQLDALNSAGISDITIVRGYQGRVFDMLLTRYPNIKFIENPHWDYAGVVVSTALVADLLAGAYLIEGDLFIQNPYIIRPYEYRTTYCGSHELISKDWYFDVNRNSTINTLKFGTSTKLIQNRYKYVGISFWSSATAFMIMPFLKKVLKNPPAYQGFVESVLFGPRSTDYEIFIRQVRPGDATEVDTFEELTALRKQSI